MGRLMTHLFVVKGAVCTGTDLVEDMVVVVGALGAVGAVVALLVSLFSCTLVLLVWWGFPLKNMCPPKMLKVPML